jgi:DNA-binding PadR family transcriptional regulator
MPWDLKNAQIYHAARQLERENLVVIRGGDAAGARHRQRIEATAKGREEIRSWLAASMDVDVPPMRDELFVRLAMARLPEDGQQLLRNIEQRELATTRLIEEYSNVWEQRSRSSDGATWHDEVPDLVLKAAVDRLQADLAWLACVRERIIDRMAAGHRQQVSARHGRSSRR